MVPNFQNLSDAQLANKLQALVFKSAVWGVPIGIFFHVNELSPHQVGVMLDALKSGGRDADEQHAAGELPARDPAEFRHDVLRGLDHGARRSDPRPTGHRRWWTRAQRWRTEYKYDLMGIDQTQFGRLGNWLAGVCAGVSGMRGQGIEESWLRLSYLSL